MEEEEMQRYKLFTGGKITSEWIQISIHILINILQHYIRNTDVNTKNNHILNPQFSND